MCVCVCVCVVIFRLLNNTVECLPLFRTLHSCYVNALTSSTGTLAQTDLDKVRNDVNERRGEHILGVVEDVEKGVREVALNGVGADLGLGGLLPR